jgi:hypothetical protein
MRIIVLRKRVPIILIILFAISKGYGQLRMHTVIPGAHLTDSSFYAKYGGCRSQVFIPVLLYSFDNDTATIKERGPRTPKYSQERKPLNHTPLLTVHGNVMYDVHYQSSVDTPYQAKDVYQHAVQTFLDITIKDHYPIRLAFSTSMGNSSLFRNITGINLQYTNRDFKNMLLNRAKEWDAGKLKQQEELLKLKSGITDKLNEINQLKSWLNGPAQLQRMVEAAERRLYKKVSDSLLSIGELSRDSISKHLAGRGWTGNVRRPYDLKLPSDTGLTRAIPAVDVDTAMERFTSIYAANQKRLDSLQKQLSQTERLYKKEQSAYGAKSAYLMDVITRSRNTKELTANLEAMDLPDSILPKGYKNLLAIRSVGIGRTIVNYSELTAKDISITGFQVEYNPSYYVAFATGVVDYRFRNFILNENRSRQYLNLIRIGAGMKEGRNIIFTYYTGKKQLYNFNTSPGSTGANNQQDHRIMGISLEGRWDLDKNNFIVAEGAKSSLPYYARETNGKDVLGSVFQLKDRTNEAYSIKAFSFIPATGTKINGLYKMMGANFQSFSLYTSGSSQTSWSVRVDQPLFKQKLTLSGSIRKNDFVSQYDLIAYRSNTIFKSIQGTLRIKKWPVVSLGYFPSSQLTLLGEHQYVENLFYTLVGTVSHFYNYRGVMMHSLFSYTQFYNRQTDSSFLYFNSKNMLLNQSVFLGKFTLNGMLSAAMNADYSIYGAEGNLQYKINKWLEMGAGSKYSRQTVYGLGYWGYSGNTRVIIPKIGELSFMADKGFIPGMNKRMVPNNNGRLTYTKIF